MKHRRHVGLAAAAASANELPRIYTARVGRHSAQCWHTRAGSLRPLGTTRRATAYHQARRAEVSAAQVLTLSAVLQGVVQRDCGHRVDVKVVEGGQLLRSPLLVRGSVAHLPRIQRYFFFMLKLLIGVSSNC